MAVYIRLDGRFKKQLKVIFQRHYADVGILENKPHKNPIGAQRARKAAWKKESGLSPASARTIGSRKTFAGGPARKTGRGSNGTLESVSEDLRKRTGINFYTRPWKDFKNREIVKFANKYVERILRPGKISAKRVENLLQAVVRNPIIRGDYGRNSKATAKAKGFNRFMIDTAQLVKGIKAKVFRRV